MKRESSFEVLDAKRAQSFTKDGLTIETKLTTFQSAESLNEGWTVGDVGTVCTDLMSMKRAAKESPLPSSSPCSSDQDCHRNSSAGIDALFSCNKVESNREGKCQPSTLNLMQRPNRRQRKHASSSVDDVQRPRMPALIFNESFGKQIASTLIVVLVAIIVVLGQKLYDASVRNDKTQHDLILLAAKCESEKSILNQLNEKQEATLLQITAENQRLKTSLDQIHHDLMVVQKKFLEWRRNSFMIPGLQHVYDMICQLTHLCPTAGDSVDAT